ncbi:tetratricopeptide repeat-containing glycosyltransferase family 2 protein [Clostridium oryzae]|uniref:SPBc2 prophage-derived glycosyltransferase SunS n=1 Tax=Clostridium oryzae TaxID=1450648 RepID=A0A1V4IVW2_9CLOT|nr:glycosyltransferase family 2 protein [Clostridium oryzae]OPJ63970.1 SPBc2 prophage-derived glycosyltransferase SunS [Clostridium oryzae]
MISISICLIVKNEEAVLARCLDSLKGIGEEIIIVDTGSTDNTKKIAEKYTDKIFDFKWIDDFSAARNFAFSKATKDYIYSADADEIIDKENYRKFMNIKKVLLNEVEIVQMKYTNQLVYGTTYNFNTEYRPKLFKRLRDFKWIEPIHETIRLEPVIYDSDIEIIHLPECNHSGRDFNTFLSVIKKGDRLSERLVSMYAKELFISGNSTDFKAALDYFKEVIEDAERSADEIKYALCVLAKGFRLNHDIHNFFKNCIKGVADKPCSEICYELGEYYYELNDFYEAAIWYYNAAFESEPYLNIHYKGDYPLKRLMQCYDALGNKEQAEIYRKALSEWSMPE